MTTVYARAAGSARAERRQVTADTLNFAAQSLTSNDSCHRWDVPTNGMVYGVLLNDRESLTALGETLHQAPYNAPPKAPVLYIKPANTWSAHGAAVRLPASIKEVEIGATVGMVLARSATGVAIDDALDHVLGYVLVNDLCEPHTSLYRPAIRQRCRNGFCVIGPWIVARHEAPQPDSLLLQTHVNGTLAATHSLAHLVRPAAQLIADVSAFMTLHAGDMLLLGLPANAARAQAGDRIRISADGLGMLENTMVRETP